MTKMAAMKERGLLLLVESFGDKSTRNDERGGHLAMTEKGEGRVSLRDTAKQWRGNPCNVLLFNFVWNL